MRPAVIDEDLRSAAEQAWLLSAKLCQGCRAYHGVWPWLRLAGLRRGLERDRPRLLALLARLLDQGRRRVLVAGTADSGLAALVLDAAAGRPLDLTLLDRCPTPLALCEALGRRLGIALATRVADLARDDLGIADVIVAHSVLAHVAAGQQPEVLRRLCRALAPEGRLVLAFRLHVEEALDPAGFPQSVVQALASSGLTPPSDPAFASCLVAHLELRARQAPFPSLAAALERFAAAGLEVDELATLDVGGGGRPGHLALLRAA